MLPFGNPGVYAFYSFSTGGFLNEWLDIPYSDTWHVIYFLEEDNRSNGETTPEHTNMTIMDEILKI